MFSVLESKPNPAPKWLFQRDVLQIVWKLARKVSIRPPLYDTEECELVKLKSYNQAIPITPYRLMVTGLVIVLGIIKATLSYLGRSTEPTTIEWVLGVVVTLGSVKSHFPYESFLDAE